MANLYHVDRSGGCIPEFEIGIGFAADFSLQGKQNRGTLVNNRAGISAGSGHSLAAERERDHPQLVRDTGKSFGAAASYRDLHATRWSDAPHPEGDPAGGKAPEHLRSTWPVGKSRRNKKIYRLIQNTRM